MHEKFVKGKFWISCIAVMLVMLTCMGARAEVCSHCGSGLFECAVCGETYMLVDDATIRSAPVKLLEADTSNITYEKSVVARFAIEEGDDENTLVWLYDSPTFAVESDFTQGMIGLLDYKDQDISCLWLAQDEQDENQIWVCIQLEKTGTMVRSYVPLEVIDESYHAMLREKLSWKNGDIDYGMRVKLKDPVERVDIDEYLREFYDLYTGPGDRYQYEMRVYCPSGGEKYVTCLWLAKDTDDEVWAYVEVTESLIVGENESIGIANLGYIHLSDIDPSYHSMLLSSLPFEQAYEDLSNHWYAWLWPDLLTYGSTKTGYTQPRYGFSDPLRLFGGEGKMIAKSGDWYMFDIIPELLTPERGWPNGERLRYWVPEGYLIY